MRSLALGAAVFALAAGGCGTGGTTTVTVSRTSTRTRTVTQTVTVTSTTATTTVATTCPANQLAVVVHTPRGNGAAGSRFYDVIFRNTGSQPCTLAGFPGVSAYGTGGEQIGSPAARSGTGPVTPFTIGPDQTVEAQLQLVVTIVHEPSLCTVAEAQGLRVYPPNDTAAVDVPFRFQACATTGPRSMYISPVG
jgi:Domain of unknown function (DUF4232)